MINMIEATETIKMITQENLDVRTITLGISLLDCIDSDLKKLNDNIYRKITVSDHIQKSFQVIAADAVSGVINLRCFAQLF